MLMDQPCLSIYFILFSFNSNMYDSRLIRIHKENVPPCISSSPKSACWSYFWMGTNDFHYFFLKLWIFSVLYGVVHKHEMILYDAGKMDQYTFQGEFARRGWQNQEQQRLSCIEGWRLWQIQGLLISWPDLAHST